MNAVACRPVSKATNSPAVVAPPPGQWVFARPAPYARTLVSQDADGRWLFNGRVVNAQVLNRDDAGKERREAMARDLAELFAMATPEEHARMSAIARAGFNCIEDLLL